MKILIAYYSRTGTTKKVAEALAEKLGAEIEEIRDTVDRAGVKGYLLAGRDAMQKRLTVLEPLKFNPANFDLVIVGTPIWGWNLSSPVRTYLAEQKNNFPRVAFFCTMGGSGDDKAALEMEKIIGQKNSAQLALKTVEVVKNEFAEKLEKFVSEIK
jgi:flavodoxin